MTTTTDRVPLAEAAKAAAARQVAARQAHAARKREQYAKNAAEAGRRVGADKLGGYGEGVTWTPDGDGDSGRSWLSATATIDGLRFRATEQYDSYGYQRKLYLREPCPNAEHQPAERELEVDDLAGVGMVLAEPEKWEDSWRCFACRWLRDPENPANAKDAPPPVPQTIEDQLVEVLREYVDGIVGERLSDFHAAYLPDRV